MSSDEEVEVEVATIPFQLQLDKPIPSQVKIAEWNPEKDLLAIVTQESTLILHRFNWQRPWTLSPGKCITSLCWRPDGKAIAIGFEDGCIALHDVENGKLLRTTRFHKTAVVCLNWEEETQESDSNSPSIYEDRTMRFFPPPPRIPRIPGLTTVDGGLSDVPEDSFFDLSYSSNQRFDILCSGDSDGIINFSIFGIFPIANIDIHKSTLHSPQLGKADSCHLLNASVRKVSLSKNLCQLIVLGYGQVASDVTGSKCAEFEHKGKIELKEEHEDVNDCSLAGLHCLVLDTSVLRNRKNELHQVAQQASNVADLVEVVRASLSVMRRQWCEAMHTFHQKFDPLTSLIADHGLKSNPQEEFLSFLFGARISPPLHQFLVNNLGEVGIKRLTKTIGGVGKELHSIVREHLQPAAEIIAFRIGELRGLSQWRARYKGIGLDEKLIDGTTEKAGMFLVQVERYVRVVSTVIHQFQNFLTWLAKSVRLLMSEPSDQLLADSESVVTFLKFHFKQDYVKELLEVTDDGHHFEVDFETTQRLEELVAFGGFTDTRFLERTLAEEFVELEKSLKESLAMPRVTISKKISCECLLPLFPSTSSSQIPVSVSYDKDDSPHVPASRPQHSLLDHVCFRIPDDSFSVPNCIGIARGFRDISKANGIIEAVILSTPEGYECVDLCLYKERQILILLNEATKTSDSPGKSCMMMVQTDDLPFAPVSISTSPEFWKLHELMDSAVVLCLENGKVRSIPHQVTSPLAVSATRGVACAFAMRRRALVFILDEDEDDVTDME